MMLGMRLDDYLRKIGVQATPGPTVDTLRRLHRAHRETFLFENFAIQRGDVFVHMLDDVGPTDAATNVVQP